MVSSPVAPGWRRSCSRMWRHRVTARQQVGSISCLQTTNPGGDGLLGEGEWEEPDCLPGWWLECPSGKAAVTPAANGSGGAMSGPVALGEEPGEGVAGVGNGGY